MSEAKTAQTPVPAKRITKPKLPKSLLEQAAYFEEKAKALRKQEREKSRARRDKNMKAISEQIRDANLDEHSAEAWAKVLPSLKSLLEKAQPKQEAAEVE
jgi:hypothetical protein